jgi:hypothetical protein
VGNVGTILDTFSFDFEEIADELASILSCGQFQIRSELIVRFQLQSGISQDMNFSDVNSRSRPKAVLHYNKNE